MSGIGDKRDVTVDFPNEVLCHVFSFLTLSEKLRSEAVNFKFQRCVIRELKANPQPFELDLAEKKVNGYKLPAARELIFGALQTLAEKAKFSSIWVRIESAAVHKRTERLDEILTLLTSENQCLTKVTSFESNAGCSQVVLENFLGKCDKLSTVKLDFNVRPLRSPLQNFPFLHSFPLDLCRLLKNRGLSNLELSLFFYPNSDLARVFQAIKPDTLRKLDLSFRQTPGLNMVELVKALSPNGSALEEIQFGFHKLEIELSGLVESLALLPALRKCDIGYIAFNGPQPAQFVSAVTSLFEFTLSHSNITMEADLFSFALGHGHQIVNMIRQIQNLRPHVVVDFDYHGTFTLILSLGNASFRKPILFHHCGTLDCVECQSLYPCVFNFLLSRVPDAAYFPEELHYFPNWRLDRCRVGQIVDHLNDKAPFGDWSVESSQDQHEVTISIEDLKEHHVGSITIGCGQCLTIGCMKCLVV